MRQDRYVYMIFAGDAVLPFYVGVGKDGSASPREKDHFRPSTWTSNKPKNDYIADCLARGVAFRFEYERGLTIDEAHAREIELIAHYGRRDLETGCLLNACAGGWGTKNKAPSTLAKHRAFRHTAEMRAHLAKAKTGVKHDEPTRAKIKAKRASQVMASGKDHPAWKAEPSPQAAATRRYRARQRGEDAPLLSNLGKKFGPKSPEAVEKTASKLRGRKASPEARAKMSAAAKARKRGPLSAETKAKIGAANGGANHYRYGQTTPLDTREKMRLAQQRRRAREALDACEAQP